MSTTKKHPSKAQIQAWEIAVMADTAEYRSGYLAGIYKYNAGNYDKHPEKFETIDRDAVDEYDAGLIDGSNGNPPRGVHGNTGNQYASGDMPMDTFLHIRANKQHKAQWVKAAARGNKKLAQWVTDVLNAAVKNDA